MILIGAIAVNYKTFFQNKEKEAEIFFETRFNLSITKIKDPIFVIRKGEIEEEFHAFINIFEKTLSEQGITARYLNNSYSSSKDLELLKGICRKFRDRKSCVARKRQDVKAHA